MIFIRKFLMLCLFASSSIGFAQKTNQNTASISRNSYFEDQYSKSIYFLLQNLSPKDGLKGSIIAAPSRNNPDYYYHWVRDAALVVQCLLDVYQNPTTNSNLKQQLKGFFLDHIKFDQQVQNSSLQFLGLGEPKFYVNGSPFMGPWGRPQNDGPGLRSSSLMRIYSIASKENWPELSQLAPLLYSAQMPTQSLIKRDLEFVGHNWTKNNVDLWEEVNGYHFYTLMAQRKSLIEGAFVANQLKDIGAAQFYQVQAQNISKSLDSFWSPQAGYILATLNMNKQTIDKSIIKVRNKSQLDTAVLLGVLHSELKNSSFDIDDARVFSTYAKLKNSFKSIYSINKNETLGVAFGRYPEDTYDGYTTNGRGNPWFLSTAAAAEYLYRLSYLYAVNHKIQINFSNIKYFQQFIKNQNLKEGQVISDNHAEYHQILQNLIHEADAYMMRIVYHRNSDGSLSEQFNRENGYMQGAPNLTWSHASFITAKQARDSVYSVYRRK